MIGDSFRRRFLSDRPMATFAKLAVLSILVGAVLSFLNVSPLMVWQALGDGVRDLVTEIVESAGDIIVRIASYLAIGAAIVAPIWLIIRVFVVPGSDASKDES